MTLAQSCYLTITQRLKLGDAVDAFEDGQNIKHVIEGQKGVQAVIDLLRLENMTHVAIRLGLASHSFADVFEERAATTGLRYGIRTVLNYEMTVIKSWIPNTLIVVVAGGLINAADVVIVKRVTIRGVTCILSLETLVTGVSVLVVVVGILWQVILNLVILELLHMFLSVVVITIRTLLLLDWMWLSLIIAAVHL